MNSNPELSKSNLKLVTLDWTDDHSKWFETCASLPGNQNESTHQIIQKIEHKDTKLNGCDNTHERTSELQDSDCNSKDQSSIEIEKINHHLYKENQCNHANSKFDVILGADIIYIEETFPDLLKTFLHFTNQDTLVLLSCKIRYKRDSTFLMMMEDHFTIKKVHFDSSRDINVFSAKRK